MNKNDIYDKKLKDKNSTYIRIGDYINQLVPIEHKCINCGVISIKEPKKVLAGRGCKNCTNTSLRWTNEIYDKKISESNYVRVENYINNLTEIEHRCKICEKLIKVRPASVLRGHKCKYCSNRVKKSIEIYSKELEDRGIVALSEYKNNHTKVLHKCSVCNTQWEALPNNILSKNSKCPTCSRNNSSSIGELEVISFIKNNYNGWVLTNDRTILEGKELDIVLPDLGLAIEYNGVYWHTEDKVGKYHHLHKTNKVNEFGYTLLHINEDEWVNKKEIVKSRLLGFLKLNKRIYARNTIIKEIPFPYEFLEKNHIQGAGTVSKYNYGLYCNDDLVAVMTFSSPRFNTNFDYELIRFCPLLFTNVVGGASKLFKHFVKTHKGNIITYSDRRWSKGNLYKKLNFEFLHTSPPNYRYYKGLVSLSRNQCQKHKLVEQGHDTSMTEKEIMKNLGYYPIYDSGNDVWAFYTEK